MQKNLKSKVLLTLLAASVFYLPAYANAAESLTIDADTEFTDSAWFRKLMGNTDGIYHESSLDHNKITINNKEFSNSAEIYGAFVNTQVVTTAESLNSNSVIVNGATFNAATRLYGAYAVLSNAAGSTANIEYNSVTVNGASFSLMPLIHGACADFGTSQNNTVNLNNNIVNIESITAAAADIYGARAEFGGSQNNEANLNNNKVTINSGITFSGTPRIYGAYAYLPGTKNNKTTLKENTVTIDGGTYSGNNPQFYGAYAYMSGATNSSATFTGNSVTIDGGTYSGNMPEIYGAYAGMDGATNSSATFTGNNVTISGGTFSSDTKIYGAYASLNGPANGPKAAFTNNTVTLTGNAGNDDNSLSNVNLYGYDYAMSSGNPVSGHSNNNLIVDGWSGQVNSVSNFDNINFENIKVDVIEDITSKLNKTAWFNIVSESNSDVSNTTVNINSIAAGDYKEGTVLGGILDLSAELADFDKDVEIAPKLEYNDNPEAVYFASDYGTNGVIANKFSEAYAYQIYNEISVKGIVADTVLAGTFIDTDGTAYYNSSQTEDTASLTIDGNLNVENASVIAGAYAAGDKAATGGKVYVAGDYRGTVYAGYSENKSAAESNNFVYIKEGTKAANLNLLGDNKDSGASGATLAVTGNGSELGNIERFDSITFDNAMLDSETAALQVKHADLDGTKLKVNSLAGGNTYSEGQNLSLLNATEGISGTSQIVLSNEIVQAGVAQELTLSPATADGNSINLTVTKVELTPQTDMVAETHAATAAFVNQGTDLINDSLDVLGRDGSYGVKTFAAVQGNRSTYDVADDLKINGWSVIAGFGAENEHNGGDFAWGVFYENGSGNYRTYNTFNNEFFRGDGSMVYNGGGIAARYENAKGVYTEGSLRAGMLKNEMDNALRDSSGASYGYETESTYYGAHIGVGQIFKIGENTDLDVYGKFFHTYTEGDTVTIGGDTFDFDHITSDRLRVGARVTKQQAKVNTYYGLAYEYEFNGDADMTVQGIRADQQSFGGGTGIAELGFNYQPGTDSPWNFDLNLRGYIGERQGGSFNVQATYSF